MMIMLDAQRRMLIARLRAAVHPEGGWGYSSAAAATAEPTALASIALAILRLWLWIDDRCFRRLLGGVNVRGWNRSS